MRLSKIYFMCFLWGLILLEGCGSHYDYYQTTRNLDGVTVYKAYWPMADSFICVYAKTESLSVINFRGYEPKLEQIKQFYSVDSVVNVVSVSSKFEESKEPMSIRLILQYKDSLNRQDWYAHSIGKPFFLDIYGCRDFRCSNSTHVVVHNEDYSYSKALQKNEYIISKPKNSFRESRHGYDCDVTEEYFFHLDVDLEDLKIDVDVQKGEETCYERDYICYGFC
ncbi:hypothetical protein [Fibrobacter succinogenes]|nr:hypothetical protein [Fibrobacter succinogenes]